MENSARTNQYRLGAGEQLIWSLIAIIAVVFLLGASACVPDASVEADSATPTSGLVNYEAGQLGGSMTFLESTPDTGEVLWHQPPLPVAPLSLFPGRE